MIAICTDCGAVFETDGPPPPGPERWCATCGEKRGSELRALVAMASAEERTHCDRIAREFIRLMDHSPDLEYEWSMKLLRERCAASVDQRRLVEQVAALLSFGALHPDAGEQSPMWEQAQRVRALLGMPSGAKAL